MGSGVRASMGVAAKAHTWPVAPGGARGCWRRAASKILGRGTSRGCNRRNPPAFCDGAELPLEGPMLGFEQRADRLFARVLGVIPNTVPAVEEWGAEQRVSSLNFGLIRA